MRWAKINGFPEVREVRQVSGNDARFFDWDEVYDWLIRTGRWDDVVEIATLVKPRWGADGLCGTRLAPIADCGPSDSFLLEATRSEAEGRQQEPTSHGGISPPRPPPNVGRAKEIQSSALCFTRLLVFGGRLLAFEGN